MNSILVLFIWLTSITFCISQPDTIVIKQRIDSLTTPEARKKYLNDLLEMDQAYRGDDVKVSHDMDNLVSVAYYLNTHGYPDKATYGDAYKILPLIFIHTSYDALTRLAFPLVYKTFQAKYTSETQVRTYYLRPLYELKFENEDYKTIPLEKLFSELDLNTTDQIPLPALINRINEIIAFKKSKKTEVLKFKAPFHEKEVTVNGTKVKMAMKTSPAEVFTLEDGRIYFHKISIDRSYEPQELIRIGENKFKFRDQETFNYLEIDAEGNLLYRNQGEVIDLYKKA
jgi:hypothetical protein